MQSLEITVKQYKRSDLVKVRGRVDSYTAPNLEEILKAITDENRFRIVLDMDEVSFISSKGWWVLIEAQKRCKRFNRGQIVLAGLDKNISDALDLIGLRDYFQLYDDVTEAVGNI